MDEIVRIFLKILIRVLVAGFGCNFIMQTISYSFYKNVKQMQNIDFLPEYIAFNENLSGYGLHLDNKSDNIILFFGGSNYIAYNSVGCFGGNFDAAFISADWYGTQGSHGKMNLKSMQNTAIDLYDWAKKHYPDKKITVMSHSYGTGIAAFLASVRNCDSLVLLASYRDLSDLYNKITPIFWGPMKLFISNNIRLMKYAKNVTCNTYIIGSQADKTLSANLQYKVKQHFSKAEIMIFKDIVHGDYLRDSQVINYINGVLV